MSTVAQVVDRVFADWLEAGDDQPLKVTLNTALGDTTGTSVIVDTPADVEDQDRFVAGVLIEVEQEQMLVTAVGAIGATITLTVRRGANGTTAATHSLPNLVKVAPVWRRKTVFDAVCDEVVGLYPMLWREVVAPMTSANPYTEISATAVGLQDFIFLSGSRYVSGQVELRTNFTPSSTTAAVVFHGVPSGKAGYIRYRARFARPANETVDLVATTGIEASWERIVVAGAVAQVLAGRSLEPVSQEFLADALEDEGYPSGSAERTVRDLVRLRNLWLEEAARAQRGVLGVRTSMSV